MAANGFGPVFAALALFVLVGGGTASAVDGIGPTQIPTDAARTLQSVQQPVHSPATGATSPIGAATQSTGLTQPVSTVPPAGSGSGPLDAVVNPTSPSAATPVRQLAQPTAAPVPQQPLTRVLAPSPIPTTNLSSRVGADSSTQSNQISEQTAVSLQSDGISANTALTLQAGAIAVDAAAELKTDGLVSTATVEVQAPQGADDVAVDGSAAVDSGAVSVTVTVSTEGPTSTDPVSPPVDEIVEVLLESNANDAENGPPNSAAAAPESPLPSSLPTTQRPATPPMFVVSEPSAVGTGSALRTQELAPRSSEYGARPVDGASARPATVAGPVLVVVADDQLYVSEPVAMNGAEASDDASVEILERSFPPASGPLFDALSPSRPAQADLVLAHPSLPAGQISDVRNRDGEDSPIRPPLAAVSPVQLFAGQSNRGSGGFGYAVAVLLPTLVLPIWRRGVRAETDRLASFYSLVRAPPG